MRAIRNNKTAPYRCALGSFICPAVNGNQNENNNVQSTVVQQGTEIGIVAQNVVDQEGTKTAVDVKKEDEKKKGLGLGGTDQIAAVGGALGSSEPQAAAAIVSDGIQQVSGPQLAALHTALSSLSVGLDRWLAFVPGAGGCRVQPGYRRSSSPASVY